MAIIKIRFIRNKKTDTGLSGSMCYSNKVRFRIQYKQQVSWVKTFLPNIVSLYQTKRGDYICVSKKTGGKNI